MFVNIYVYILVKVTPADEALNVPAEENFSRSTPDYDAPSSLNSVILYILRSYNSTKETENPVGRKSSFNGKKPPAEAGSVRGGAICNDWLGVSG